MGSVFADRPNHMNDSRRQPIKQPRKDDNSVRSNTTLAALAQLEGLVNRHADDEIGRFQLLARGVKELAHFVWNPSEPVLADRTRSLAASGARFSQGPTLREAASIP